VAVVVVAVVAVVVVVVVAVVVVAVVAVVAVVVVVARRRPVGEMGAGLQKAAGSQQLEAGLGARPPWAERARGWNSRRRRMRTVRVQKQPMCRLLFCDQPAL
jgi:hypothetical protein